MAESGIVIKVDVKELLAKLDAGKRKLSAVGILKAVGLRQLKWVDDNFRSDGGLVGGWKPLSPFTIMMRRNGSSKPLQDTGILRASFNPKKDSRALTIEGNTVKIGSAVPYASYHEFGTGPIYPIFKKALGVKDKWALKHTAGIPRRRMLPDQQQAGDIALSVVRAKVERLNDASS